MRSRRGEGQDRGEDKGGRVLFHFGTTANIRLMFLVSYLTLLLSCTARENSADFLVYPFFRLSVYPFFRFSVLAILTPQK